LLLRQQGILVLNIRSNKRIIYVDMDDVLCAFTKAHNERIQSVPEIKYPQCEFDFFRKLEPMEGAIEGFKFLFENFDTYILTAPSMINPLCYTEKRLWVEDHLGYEAVKKLIISPNKSLLIGDYLIDDKVHGKGQDQFKGKLIQFSSNQFKTWNDIIEHFKYFL